MKKKKGLLVFLFFLAVLGLFFWPVLVKGWVPFPGDLLVGNAAPWTSYSFLGYAPGGVPHKAQGIDVVRQLFPWKHFSTEILKKGQVPLWNPYNFSGNPHLANFQTAIFYPLNIIFLLLPFWWAWTIFITIQPLLACLFTYLFLRQLKVSRTGSIFAAIAFAYSLYFTVWLEWGNIGHAILWLPLALFLVEKIIKKLKWKWVALLVFSLASSILAGYIQVTIYLFAVVYAYFFFRLFSGGGKQEKFTKIAVVLSSGLTALLVCAVQLLPTWEIFQYSARRAYTLEKIRELLLPWFHLVTSFVPDFFGNPASRNYWYPGTYIERVTYIGVLPLFFALMSIFYRRKEKIPRFFIGLAALVLLLTLNLPPARLFYGLKIPIISTTVPTRMLYVFAFSMAILAGFGFDWCWQKKASKKVRQLMTIFLGFYLFLWLFTFLAPKFFGQSWWVSHLSVTRRNLILPTFFAFCGGGLIFLFYHWPKMKKWFFLAGIGFLTLFDLYFYFQKITPFSPKEFVYPQTEIMEFVQKQAGINRFWGYGSGYIDTNFSTYTGTFSTDGYDPLFIDRYGELISASEDGKIKKPIPRSDVFLSQGYGQEALRENFYRQRLLNLLGVKYVLHKVDDLNEKWQPDEQTFPSENYQLVWQKGVWQVYENQLALPRAFLVGDYQVEKETQKIVDLLLNPQFSLEQKIILEKPLPENFILDEGALGQVELVRYQANKIEFKTVSSGNNLLFLSDNFYPGWRAEVDSQETEIYRANYAFRAVLAPKGEHQVIFQYQPRSFNRGVQLTLTSLSVIILLSLWGQKKLKSLSS